ncbi:putative membrane protein [Campylobacter sp. RM5004]|uniref:SH3 domain-containing protein n=1 Tax=Campylobacter sp. RM5004 TaxID=1660078 RepID=UPI001EFAE364|nr:SH3 domain-containing protein [Campylobacter sp. RM5004]ULO01125.1 putative membrane protein [Campylobacter sp. RM5004]
MKKLIFLIFAITLFAAPSKELSVMDAQVYTNLNQNEEASSFNSNIKEEFKDFVELAIEANFSKSEVKIKEVFYADITINSNHKTNFTPQIEFEKSIDMQVLTKDIKFSSENGVYKTRVYFQANTANAKLNSISAKLFRNTQEIGNAKISLNNISINELKFNKDYSQLVASNLKITNLKCTEYDETSTICGMDAKAENTNFNNFSLKNVKSQSITNVGKDYENAKCSIALIFPNNLKSFSFSYFDPIQNDFIEYSNNIVVESEEISTQTDLNPITKEINFYLQIGSLILAIICLVIVVIFKRFFSLIAVALVFIAFAFIDGGEFSNAKLKAGANVRILPTNNSTIFYKNTNLKEVKVLAKKDDFVKVALDEDTSGWVKNEDIE